MLALALLLSPQFAVAINNPIMWNSANEGGPPAAVGVSGYIGLDDDHHVDRLRCTRDGGVELALQRPPVRIVRHRGAHFHHLVAYPELYFRVWLAFL